MTYWKATLKNGQSCSEKDSDWHSIKDEISALSLVLENNQEISLPKNMPEYIQAKSAMANVGSSDIQIESRYIGIKNGNNTIRIRVNERTQNISLEIQ